VVGKNCNVKSIIRIIKSMMIRWVGHVAITREEVDAYRILVGKTEKGDNLEDQDIGEWTILQRILVRTIWVLWVGLIWLRIGAQLYEVSWLIIINLKYS
jgi:hypothetical protein